MNMLLLFALFCVFTEAQETKGAIGEVLKPTKRPEYKGYPFSRAKHPVVGFSNGNRENEIFNFCGNPQGFDSSDFKKGCFLLPWLTSIAIPPVIFIILCLFTCCSACIYGCCRICLNQCCFATEGCCCGGKMKQYKKSDWISFLIATIVLVVIIQVPFFITGLVGNSSMTVALSHVSDELFSIYPDMRGVAGQLLDTVDSIDFSKIKDLFAFANGGNNTNTNNTKSSVYELQEYDGMRAIELINDFKKQLAIQEERDLHGELKGGPAAGLREGLEKIDKILSNVLYYVELAVNILLACREAIFDIVLILPLIGGILMVIGALLKIHQLSVSFFPCAVIFSYIAISFVAIEYPITTFLADGCVIIYNVLEGVKDTKPMKIETLEDLTGLFSNFSMEVIVNEALKIFVDCEKSLLGNISGTINNIVDNAIDSMLGTVNLTGFEGLLDVCTAGVVPGVFYNYGKNGNSSNTLGTYGVLTYDDCRTVNSTKCVYDILNYSLSQNKTTDPLLVCNKIEKKEGRNKLIQFLNIFASLTNMSFVDQNVYWVSKSDFQDYAVKTESNGNLTEETLKNLMDKLQNFDGVLTPEMLEMLTGATGGSQPKSMTREELKQYILQKASSLKGAGEGERKVYCANLNGIEVDPNGKTTGFNVSNIDVTLSNGTVVKDYMYTPIACTESSKIAMGDCPTKCPKVVQELIQPMAGIFGALEVFNQITTIINNVIDMVNKISNFVGCGTLGRIAEELPKTICKDYLKAEVTLVAGLVAYGLVLWIMFIFGLVAIKRFNRANYLPVDKDDDTHYNQGEVEME